MIKQDSIRSSLIEDNRLVRDRIDSKRKWETKIQMLTSMQVNHNKEKTTCLNSTIWSSTVYLHSKSVVHLRLFSKKPVNNHIPYLIMSNNFNQILIIMVNKKTIFKTREEIGIIHSSSSQEAVISTIICIMIKWTKIKEFLTNNNKIKTTIIHHIRISQLVTTLSKKSQ